MTAPSSAPPPRWARSLDFLCLLILVVSLVIAMSGGFRVRVGDLRIALTSPYRLLVWAVLLAIVRHVLAPGAPIYRDLPRRIAGMWRTAEVRAAVSVFAGTRPAILFVGYLAVFMIGFRPEGAPWRIADNEFVNLQTRWDTGWYLTVAIEGYSYDPGHPTDQQDIAFFPAYPILMRAAGRLLGGASTAYLLGGTLVALGAFLWALIYLFRFARDVLGDEEQAETALWLLAAYPFALFYGAVYSESLYLLGVVGTFYHFRRRELLRAALWGLLVGLTRAPGGLLSIPLGIAALSPWLPHWLTGSAPPDALSRSGRAVGSLFRSLVAAAMPAIGVLLYFGYVWWLTGHPFAWTEGQAAWGRHYNGLGFLVTQRVEWLSQGGLYEYTSNVPGDLLNLLGALFVVATAWPVARRLGVAYAAFMLISILPPLAVGGFLSAGRFSSVIFPSFVWMGGAVPRRYRAAWTAGFMAIQAFDAVLFYTWRPLY